MAKKVSYKVIGYAATPGEADIEVMVKADSTNHAKDEAVKKEPALAKHKDVRIYKQGGWVRVQ